MVLERFTPWQLILSALTAVYALRNLDKILGLDGNSQIYPVCPDATNIKQSARAPQKSGMSSLHTPTTPPLIYRSTHQNTSGRHGL